MMNNIEDLDDDELFDAYARSSATREKAVELGDSSNLPHIDDRLRRLRDEIQKRGL